MGGNQGHRDNQQDIGVSKQPVPAEISIVSVRSGESQQTLCYTADILTDQYLIHR